MGVFVVDILFDDDCVPLWLELGVNDFVSVLDCDRDWEEDCDGVRVVVFVVVMLFDDDCVSL